MANYGVHDMYCMCIKSMPETLASRTSLPPVLCTLNGDAVVCNAFLLAWTFAVVAQIRRNGLYLPLFMCNIGK